ncbi:4-vinyl reductase [Candidatus Synechococcus calcipolaris G9]|uniref:4-vinyl reductase n=1 Tax=Candidatus Synechococcus calcipolaris G9 TaxID=1497997 RepID=A0ABT6F1F3_9SYNE|nr:V4R domain-containing protein [Candidatus Synechococcus calcipolaris]MDG2991689.1 4-vinyl reductase [Candidatus Synechococcus calcipolaris G9]
MTSTLPKRPHHLQAAHPQRRHHFSLKDFFEYDSSLGSITDWHQSRQVLVTEDFVIGLVQGLEEEVGSASGLVMYKVGEVWGQKDAQVFQKHFEQEYERELRRTALTFLLEAWWWPFVSEGWGNWEVDLTEQRNGFMFINIFDSVVARTLGDVGKPVCYLYAGLFAGFFTELIQKPLGCIEIQCYAMGETYCKFLVGKQDRIDAATFWQNEGATTRDIEKRLRQGELIKK